MECYRYMLVIWSVLRAFTVVNASENIALGKTTNHSSTLGNYDSSKAIDGCTNQTLGSNCCTHTDVGHKEAWWQIDLQTTSVIDYVTIIYRNGYPHRLAGYEVYLSNTPDWTSGTRCHKDTTPDKTSMSLTQDITCPGVARYLTIYNDRRVKAYSWYSNPAFLELCEVQVYGCQLGRYGNGNCNGVCMNCLNDICDTTSGGCNDCTSGYYKIGGDCVPCPVNCVGNTCDSLSGACLGGCNTGFSGTYCRCPVNCKDESCTTGQCTVCNDGYYGSACTSCPTGCSTNTCDKTYGHCSECDAGYYGSFCDQSCPSNCLNNVCEKFSGQCPACNDGFYGPICTPCPVGCSITSCDKTSGHCFQCADGFYSSFCNQSCPLNCTNNVCSKDYGQCTECDDGYHGVFCNQSCPANCKNSVCKINNGQCTDCADGYHGSFCNESCPVNCSNGICDISDGYCNGCKVGSRGNTCNQTCPSNCKNDECEQMNGECTACAPGFHGNFCSQACPTNCKNNICNILDGQCAETEALKHPTDSQVGAYAGAGVGVAVLIAVAVIVVIVVLRRRKSQPKQKKSKHSEHIGEVDDTSFMSPGKSGRNSDMTSKTDMPAKNDEANEVCDVAKKDEEVVYSNMDTSHRVTIDDIRAMLPKKMENNEEEFKQEFKALPWGAVHPHSEGTKATNKPKNRFKTTFPYDHSRVILNKIGNDPDSTYINANYIDSTEVNQAYVACQGPKEKTVDDFWRMVWQLNTGKIVMVTNLIEGGNVKCHQYWPDEGKPLSTRHFNISLDRERTYAFYVLRELSLTHKKTKEERQVHQFHFTAWPDHGTPGTPELVLFHRRVTSYRTHLNGQMVVHCSAGLGRTGTFIGLDALSKEEKKSGQVDIPGYIRKMREDRMNMVQTHEQYIALHELLVEAHDLTDTLISDADFPETLRKILPSGKPTNQTKLRKEFEKLQTLIPKHDLSCYKAGMKKENKNKNRTMSIVAADKYRAYLRSQAGGRTDYINAVMLQSHRSKSGYLVTQFPLEGTVDDLWTMVIDYNCENIVVLGNPTEHWLRKESETNETHAIFVRKQSTLEVIPDIDIADYVITSKSSDTDMSVRIFSMKDWSSDSLLPPSNSSLLLLLEQLDSRRRSDNTIPVVVMCQDGCTQSGLFCCISNARDQMKMDNEVDIFQTSRQLQARRPQALRHIEQYQFCYNFIGQYLDSTNIYIN